MEKPKCETCKKVKGDKWDAADCKVCVPPLMPENEDAALVYMIVHGQFIMGLNGAVALDQKAVHEAMRLYRINDRIDCFEKVVRLGQGIIAMIIEKQTTAPL